MHDITMKWNVYVDIQPDYEYDGLLHVIYDSGIQRPVSYRNGLMFSSTDMISHAKPVFWAYPYQMEAK